MRRFLATVTATITGSDLAEKARRAGILPAKPPGTAGYSYYLRTHGYGRFEIAVVGADFTALHFDPTTGTPLRR